MFNANGDASIIRCLVTAGADPDKLNASGRSPKELANTIANYDTFHYFDGPASTEIAPQ